MIRGDMWNRDDHKNEILNFKNDRKDWDDTEKSYKYLFYLAFLDKSVLVTLNPIFDSVS